jgi:sarcosine oxidase/L-pipecolate oxidase
LKKLHGFGVTGGELDWFKDYLNRKQLVDYLNTYSDPLPLKSGVPQGSILGPLLFVIFVNDLPNAVNSCSILMYADDTVIFYSGKSVTDIENVLSSE